MEKILVLLVFTCFICGCTRKNDSPCLLNSLSKSIELKITTRTFYSFAFKEAFGKGDTIGIGVFSDSVCQQTAAIATSVLFGNRLEWICQSPIRLTDKPVAIYAYAPSSFTICSHSSSLSLEISSNATTTPDYVYGKLSQGHKPVSNRQPWAMLSLRSVLSHLSFRIKRGADENKPLYLSAVCILNRPGETLFSQRGKLDLRSGRFTAFPDSGGSTLLPLNPPLLLSDSFSESGEIKVFPIEQSMKGGEIQLIFLLNRKKYAYSLPEGTRWKPGYRYVYEFIFRNEHLYLHKMMQEII